MQIIDIVKGGLMAASISLLLLSAKMANAENMLDKNIPVLKQSLNRGDVLTFDMLTTQEFRGQIIPAVIVKNPGEIIGKEAVRRVRAGSPLYKKQFREVPTVKKGMRATVVFTKGKVRLTTDGMIMADAQTGDFVKVLNKDSKQMLQGIVQSNGTIFVN